MDNNNADIETDKQILYEIYYIGPGRQILSSAIQMPFSKFTYAWGDTE